MMSCRRVAILLSQQAERNLNWRERTVLRLHLLFCKLCRGFSQDMNQLRGVAGDADQLGDSSEQLSPGARQRLRDELKKHES